MENDVSNSLSYNIFFKDSIILWENKKKFLRLGGTDINIFYVKTIHNTIKTIDGFAKTIDSFRLDRRTLLILGAIFKKITYPTLTNLLCSRFGAN